MLDKKTDYKKGYFRLLQVLFLGFFIFFIFIGVLGILYEDDIPFAGFVWAGVVVLVYWAIKKILKST